MVEISEVVGQETLEQYLEDQPSELSALIASRSAQRLVPNLLMFFDLKDTKKPIPDYVQSCMRAILISSGAGTWPHEDIRIVARTADAAADAYTVAAYAAYASAFAAAAYADDAAAAAAYAADAAAAAAAYAADADVFWAFIREELTLAQTSEKGVLALHELPLWQTPELPMSADLQEHWAALQTKLLATDANWQFWIDWYDRCLRAAPQDWDLLKQVAFIADADWEQGSVHTNDVIARIVGKHLAANAPHAETISRHPANKQFYSEPDRPSQHSIFRASMDGVQEAAAAFADPILADVTETIAKDLVTVQAVLDDPTANMLTIYQRFNTAWLSLENRLKKMHNWDDFEARNLMQALDTAAINLRTHEPQVRQYLDGLVAVRYERAGKEELKKIRDVIDAALQSSDEHLQNRIDLAWFSLMEANEDLKESETNEYSHRYIQIPMEPKAAFYELVSLLTRMHGIETEEVRQQQIKPTALTLNKEYLHYFHRVLN